MDLVLPERLRRLVEDHNAAFQKEIDDYDAAKGISDPMSQVETLVSDSFETVAKGSIRSLEEIVNEHFVSICEKLGVLAKKRSTIDIDDGRLEHFLCFLEAAPCSSQVRMHALVLEGCNQFPLGDYSEDWCVRLGIRMSSVSYGCYSHDDVKKILLSKLDDTPVEAREELKVQD